MKKKIFMAMLLFFVFALPVPSFAVPVDYAHLDYGASIESYSSFITDSNYNFDPRDVIGGMYSWSNPFLNEKGNFIFDQGDADQYVIVDLGTTRNIDRVGAWFSQSDREVWDYFGVSGAMDISSFFLLGSIGTKNDSIRDINSGSEFFDLSSPIEVRYLLYEFGEYSHDWGGGSRVAEVYAIGESTSVPEPSTMFLFGFGLLGFVVCRKIRCYKGGLLYKTNLIYPAAFVEGDIKVTKNSNHPKKA